MYVPLVFCFTYMYLLFGHSGFKCFCQILLCLMALLTENRIFGLKEDSSQHWSIILVLSCRFRNLTSKKNPPQEWLIEWIFKALFNCREQVFQSKKHTCISCEAWLPDWQQWETMSNKRLWNVGANLVYSLTINSGPKQAVLGTGHAGLWAMAIFHLTLFQHTLVQLQINNLCCHYSNSGKNQEMGCWFFLSWALLSLFPPRQSMD